MSAKMKSLPNTERELQKEALRLGLLGPKPSLKNPRCKLVKFVNDSKRIYRSFNYASILLVGSSGVGKSSTINHLLNIGGKGVQFAKTSANRSETRITSEFIVSADEPKYEVKDLQLGIVDSPGFNDTDGYRQDACNFYSIKKFYQTHPKLSGCYPNLIFLLVPSTDTRIEGENSNLAKSLRCLNELRLVDHRHPNVVAILSFCCSVAHKNVGRWIEKIEIKKKSVQDVIFNALRVTAPVVLLENDYEDEELEVVGDYTRLPDGQLQPKNLYDACEKVLSKNKDNLGLITLNACFSKLAKKAPSTGHKTSAKDATKERLSPEEEEFVKFFEKAAKGGAKDPIIDTAQEYIEKNNLNTEQQKEVQEIASSLKRMGLQEKDDCSSVSKGSIQYFHGDTISPVGTDMLEKEFKVIKKAANLDSGRLVGQGYNILNDKPVASQIMKYETVEIDLGIVIPTCAKFEKVNETRSFMDQYEDDATYTKSRLTKMNVSIDVEYGMFNMAARAGYSKKKDSESHSSTSEYSFLFEQRMFELKIANFKEYLQQGVTFTTDFTAAVERLPKTYDKDDASCRSKFERFFNQFGHFMVTSAYGGGAIETKNVGQKCGSETLSFEEVKSSLSASFDGGIWSASGDASGSDSSSVSTKASALLSQSTMHWFGGSPELHKKNTVQNQEMMLKWQTSLLLNPTMLSTEMCLEPISTVISCVDPEIDQASYDALKDLLGGEFKVLASREKDREEEKRKKEEEAAKAVEPTTRTETVKEPDSSGSSCFPSSSLVRIEDVDGNIVVKQIIDVTVGDKVIAWSAKRNCMVASEVIMFAHRKPNIQDVEYLKIVLEDGKSITLSDNHLVMVGDRFEATMAKNVHPGHILFTVDEKGRLSLKKVLAVEKILESGIFSPITTEGNLVVNDVLASCYCSIADRVFLKGLIKTSAHHVAHLVFLPMRFLHKLNVKWVAKLPKDNSIHPYAKWLCKLKLPWMDRELELHY